MIKLPDINNLRPAGNETVTANSSDYVLFNRPTFLEDTFFKKYDNACVDSYTLQIKNGVPTGTVHLAIWRSTQEFYIGAAPVAMLDVSEL